MLKHLIALTLVVALMPASAAFASGDAKAGAKLVQASGCEGCHGPGLAGATTAPKLVGIEHRMSASAIASAIKAPKAPMPNFGFTDAQISNIVAYLSGLDGGTGKPVVKLAPAKPTDHATVSVTFPGTPPEGARVQATMDMGKMSHGTGWLPLQKTSDPHTLAAKVQFSMGGAWMIHVKYGGQEMDLPVNVGG